MPRKEYEYTPFGDKFLRREKDSTDDWKEVPHDDVGIAKEALKAKEKADAAFHEQLANTPPIQIRRVSQGEPPFEA